MKRIVLCRIKKIAVCAAVFLCAAFFLSAEMQSLERRTVKVAYFDLGNYYQKQPDGSVSSFDTSYLSVVSDYAPLSFEFVDCGTWDNALKMLEAHEIDLVGTMQRTSEREERYAMCAVNYGYTIAELAARADTDFIYEDYDAIQNAVVGLMDGYVIEQQLEELMKSKNLHFTIRRYRTQNELDRALETGEIDLVAANSHAIHSDWRLIEKFAYAPFYFASWKGNEKLAAQISEAIIQINLHQPDRDDRLFRKWFPVMVSSPLNKSEVDCISKNKHLTVYLAPDAKPLAWFNRSEGKMEGVLVDICRELAKITSLDFTYVPDDEADHSLESDAMFRTICSFCPVYGSSSCISDSVITLPFRLYHRIGSVYETGRAYTVGVVRNRDGVREYIQEKYPDYTIVEYGSPQECMRRLYGGKIDLVFIDLYSAENVIIAESLGRISAVPMTDVPLGFGIQFYGEDAQTLCSIVNKGLHLLDVSVIDNAMMKHTRNISPKINVRFFVQQHFSSFIVLLVLCVCMVLWISFLAIYAVMMKRDRNRMIERNEERSDFFARISHDLRTPMNGIVGMLELAGQSETVDEIRENMKTARSSCRYMLSLINDILDMQKLEHGKLKFDRHIFCIKDFIENVSDMIKPAARKKNIRFSVEFEKFNPDRSILEDELRLKQVFMNILSNAVKFTPENGSVVLSFETVSANDKTERVKIQFRDTGIGMSRKFIQNSLFTPYSQELNDDTERSSGSGLGLSISKNIIELMNGSIDVQSTPGEGTVFTVCLDFTFADEVQEKKTALESDAEYSGAVNERIKGARVLVCEDVELNSQILCRLLENAGCIVTAVKDGKKCLDAFSASAPGAYDVILMDVRMPVMNGLEATRAIRNLDRPDAKTVPVIAMTANSYESDKEECFSAGMTAHLSKPIEPLKMYETVARCIKK